MVDRSPVSTVAEVESLDSGEMVEGYWSGRDGDPEPGDNRSKAYWHGWRNGRSDAGHPVDAAQMALAREIVERR